MTTYESGTPHPRKKTSLGESLVESHAYNPIRDSGETLGEREKFRQASAQNLGSDYMYDSPQDSLRNSFFYAGNHQVYRLNKLFFQCK